VLNKETPERVKCRRPQKRAEHEDSGEGKVMKFPVNVRVKRQTRPTASEDAS
jgi:hypothetical protein